MAKRSSEKNTAVRDVVEPRSTSVAAPALWSRGWPGVVISMLILLHLTAVVAEPFRMFARSARGGSPVADSIRRILSPYVEFAYLNHGYFFFAPEPGPSHVMECRLSKPNEEVRRMRFPDRQAQWPRLLYHRHFMLAEFLNTIFVPSELIDEANRIDIVREQWARGRRTYDIVRESMERHLAKAYNFDTAELRRVEHRWPTAFEVFDQDWSLDDERLYILLPESPPIEPPLAVPGLLNPKSVEATRESRLPAYPLAPEEIRP